MMMHRACLLIVVIVLTSRPIQAGLYSSLEPTNPFPAAWRGFLPDQRILRMVAVDPGAKIGTPPSPLRESYSELIVTLEAAAKSRVLNEKELTDLSAAYCRLAKPEKAIALLRTARRTYPDNFKLAANLGTAFQLAGDLSSSQIALDDAVRLAPESAKRAEKIHLVLVSQRLKEGRTPADHWDDLFGKEADYDAKKVPADAAEVVQQLALWLPADGRLLWQLGEIAHATGDVRTAANILDGCVGEFGMASANLRTRRTKYRAEADRLANDSEHTRHGGTLTFRSSRPLGSTFDESKLPAIREDGTNPLPWGAVQMVTVGKGFKPKYLKHVDQLDGKTVSITGYPAIGADGAESGSFLLTEYPIGCWFCESPDATSIIRIELAPGRNALDLPRGTVKLTGTLKLNRTDPERFLYSIEKARLAIAD
ncbi:MAG: hypothetical protein U0798_03505 [Gemmataceae bacterium]